MPRSAARRDPSPERACAVGTVPGAVMSPRLAGRPPLSKWSGGCRTSCRRPCSAFGGHFLGKIGSRGPPQAQKRPILTKKWPWKARTDKRRWKSAVSADLNDARKRVPTAKSVGMSADRRRGWARGGLPRTASPLAPPPEARRAEERGRTPRRTPPIFTRAALPEGHRPAWPPSPDLEESRGEAQGERVPTTK